MSNRFICMAVLMLAGISLISATTAKADLIDFNSTYGPLPTAWGPSTVTSLQRFDPSLGTLTKITLTLNTTTSGGFIAWDNESRISTDVDLSFGTEITISALGTLTTSAMPMQTASITGVLPDNDGVADFVGSDSFTLFAATASASNSNSTTLPGELALFIGLDTYDVDLASVMKASSMVSGGFGPTDMAAGVIEGMIGVMYEYTPIPEPATVGLFVGGLLFFRRKQKKHLT